METQKYTEILKLTAIGWPKPDTNADLLLNIVIRGKGMMGSTLLTRVFHEKG